MNNKNNYRFLVTVCLLLVSNIACAGEMGDVIRELQTNFKDAVAVWYGPLINAGRWLLLSLTVISLFWIATQLLIQGAGLQEMVASLVRLLIWTGFWLFLIENAQTLTQTLIQGWVWLGGQATGRPFALQVHEIFERGMTIGGTIYDSSTTLTAVPYAILAALVVVLYALITAYAFFIVIEMYVVTAASVIVLGFAGSDWTADYARKYIVYCMAVGMKLYVVFLIVGTGETFVNDWAAGLNYEEMPSIFSLLGMLIIVLVLVALIPDTVQGMITGASLGRATPTVGGMAKQAASVATGAVAGAAGATLAVREASKMAGEQGASGLAGTTLQAGKNLATSAGRVVAGRIMGGYKASHGTLGGSMAQDLRAFRTAAGEQAAAQGYGSTLSANSSPDVAGDFRPNASSVHAANTGNTLNSIGGVSGTNSAPGQCLWLGCRRESKSLSSVRLVARMSSPQKTNQPVWMMMFSALLLRKQTSKTIKISH